MLDLDKDNFIAEVEQSDLPVVVEFWGQQCAVCLALMPEVEKLAASRAGRIKFCRIAIAGCRRLCLQLRILSVPTFLFYRGGECKARLSGDGVNLEEIRVLADALLRTEAD
ncbi:MAG: thioredoxin family protein [Deltaproteobacteria bacterium]|jgi:thioredoxin 1|nr:thioredoxin family protein [Deltaproteobacteria bacterium]